MGTVTLRDQDFQIPYYFPAQTYTPPNTSSNGPFSAGVLHSTDFGKTWRLERISDRIAPATALCETTSYTYFFAGPYPLLFSRRPAVEWVWTLHNAGATDSSLLEDIRAADVLCRTAAGGSNFVLHAARGGLATPQDYELLTYDLATQSRVTLRAAGGRSSNLNLPFWNLESGGTGWVFGLGWSGQWKSDFERVAGQGVRVRAGMERTRLRLHAGESIRTPRMLVLAYAGGSLRGQNLLRRYLYRHVTPLLAGRKPLPAVWSDTWWSSGDGGGNSGSFATEINQAQLLRALGRSALTTW